MREAVGGWVASSRLSSNRAILHRRSRSRGVTCAIAKDSSANTVVSPREARSQLGQLEHSALRALTRTNADSLYQAPDPGRRSLLRRGSDSPATRLAPGRPQVDRHVGRACGAGCNPRHRPRSVSAARSAPTSASSAATRSSSGSRESTGPCVSPAAASSTSPPRSCA